MSSLREQCDFMSNVVRRAIIMGMNHEQFAKLAETAWLVLTAEPAPVPEALPDQPLCTCTIINNPKWGGFRTDPNCPRHGYQVVQRAAQETRVPICTCGSLAGRYCPIHPGDK